MAKPLPPGKDSSVAVHRPRGPAYHGSSLSAAEILQEHNVSTPPPYSGPSHSPPSPITPPVILPGLPKLNYALYNPSGFKWSSDETSISTSQPEYSTNAMSLRTLIQEQATIPPKPMVRVKGKSLSGTVDFDIRLNMMTLVCGNGERWNYLKTIGNREMGFRGGSSESMEPAVTGGLDGWVSRYCEDTAIKQFTIERVVTNWDTEYLEGRLHSLIASTNYRGQVEISFPLTHNKVVLKSSYKQRDILTNLANLFSSTRKYGVVQVVWPYASVKPGVDGRQFAVQSEENWWADWKDAIRGAVLGRRNGWVTVEDQLEVLMNMNRVAGSASEWGGY